MAKTIVSKAPGRICLFGDHQDYLGLPVIAAAIDRYIWIKARKNDSDLIKISMPDLEKQVTIDIKDSFDRFESRDYFRSGLKVADENGCKINSGFDAEISGNIPINAGASSSSALVSAWINLLFELYHSDSLSPDKLARYTYQAEVLEHKEPGGYMDQFTCSIGGVLFIENKAEIKYEALDLKLDGLLLANSHVPKETLHVLADNRNKGQQAISILAKRDNNYSLDQRTEEHLEGDLNLLPDDLRPIYTAAIKNHIITQHVFQLIKNDFHLKQIADLMNQHHLQLKDNVKVTVPKIDQMVDVALQSGALACKINGSGLGGTVVVLAPNHEDKVISALQEVGASAEKISLSSGAEISYE